MLNHTLRYIFICSFLATISSALADQHFVSLHIKINKTDENVNNTTTTQKNNNNSTETNYQENIK